MVSFLIHSWNVWFVVFVSLLQSCISVFNVLFFLAFFEGWNGTELVKDLMLFLESESSKEMFEIIDIKLSFTSFVNNSQQTSNFLSWYLFSTVIKKCDEIFSSDEVTITAQHFEDLISIKIKRAE